jgi:GAF domain-containing protein
MSKIVDLSSSRTDGSGTEESSFVAALSEALQLSQKKLAECTEHLQMLYDVSAQLNQQLPLNDVIRVAVESIWQAAEIDFVAIILGEDELGPFRYAGVRGIDDPLSVLEHECNVPLWGLLAQALVNRPTQGEPDYLIVQDIAAEGRPRPEEFPWKVESGCFMVIPLRHGIKTVGALLIGSRTPYYFSDSSLCYYLYALAGNTTRAIQERQSRLQSNRWLKQLISLQAFTRSITRIQGIDAILAALKSELEDLFGDVTLRIFLRPAEKEIPTSTGSMVEANVSGKLIPLQLLGPDPIGVDEHHFLLSLPMMELIRWVMEAEQPLFFEPSTSLADASDLYYRSSGRGILVPVGEGLGVMIVSAPNRATPFDESDMIVMRTIANSAAIAIDNPRFIL